MSSVQGITEKWADGRMHGGGNVVLIPGVLTSISHGSTTSLYVTEMKPWALVSGLNKVGIAQAVGFVKGNLAPYDS
jgi:hypothetical protein